MDNDKLKVIKTFDNSNKKYGDLIIQLTDSVRGLAELLSYDQINSDEMDYLVETVGILNTLKMKTDYLIYNLANDNS